MFIGSSAADPEAEQAKNEAAARRQTHETMRTCLVDLRETIDRARTREEAPHAATCARSSGRGSRVKEQGGFHEPSADIITREYDDTVIEDSKNETPQTPCSRWHDYTVCSRTLARHLERHLDWWVRFGSGSPAGGPRTGVSLPATLHHNMRSADTRYRRPPNGLVTPERTSVVKPRASWCSVAACVLTWMSGGADRGLQLTVTVVRPG